METLFLSHSHGDRDLAAAVKQLIENCFPGYIEVKASSAPPAEGGIQSGSDWLEWILEQVQSSKFTAVLLTPGSIGKPWLMWETGAVSGVAMAKGQASTVIPLVYRLSMEQVPSPLRSRQAAMGEDKESIKRVMESLKQATPQLPDLVFRRLVESFVPAYLESVAKALADTPPPLTDSAVQDWLDRIDYFVETDRRSEVGHLHRAMVQVFAPGGDAFAMPLDVRLHRRLGDVYLFSKQPAEAARQFDLALRLSPRDIFLMHKKALALLDSGDEPGAQAILDRLLTIDPEATRRSTEIAGFKGRLLWQKYKRTGAEADLRASRDAYADGLSANGDSHYMADNVGQLSLLLREAERAREAFQKGLAALQKTGDKGYWAVAARASCHLGLGAQADGLELLRQVNKLHPEPAALDSIRRGLIRLHQGLGGAKEELETWLQALAAE